MRTTTVAVMLGLTLGSAGCSYQRAMYGAGRAARAHDWDLALARYEKARTAKPDSEQALARWEHTRERAIEEALADARLALDELRYEEVVERIGYVIRLDTDSADAWALVREAEDALVAHVAEAKEGDDPREAYALAVRLRALFPGSDAIEPTFAELRTYWRDGAEGLLRDGRYEEALAAIETIATYEPDQKDLLVTPVAERIESAWADHLVKQARVDERAGRQGMAALKLARAWEIAGRPADRAAAQRLAAALEDRGKLTVSLQINGNRSRAATLRSGLAETLEEIGHAELVYGKADLAIYMSAPTVTCNERPKKARKSRDWVAGQVQVPNPEHHAVSQEITAATQAREDAHERALAKWKNVEQAEGRVKAIDTAIAQAQAQVDALARRHDEAVQQHQAALRLRDERADELDAMRKNARTTAEALSRVEASLGEVAGVLLEWQDTQLRVQEDKSEAERLVSRLTQERKNPADELARLRGEYDAILAERTAHEQRRNELTTKLAYVPRTVPQDVVKTHTYEETTWTRTCAAPTWTAMRPRWDSTIGGEQRHSPRKVQTDVSFAGHAASGLKADPKTYEERDWTLIKTADQETATALSEWLVRLADEHYRVGVSEALTASMEDPNAGITDLLAYYLGARERLGENEQEMVRRLAASVGVRDLDAALTRPSAVAAAP